MTPGQLAQARAVIRAAHVRLAARLAGAERDRDRDGRPDLCVVMLDADDGLGLVIADPGTRQQLDDICCLGRSENIIVHVTERKS